MYPKMNPDFFTDLAITETIREQFAKKLEITRMIVRDIQVGVTSHASVFRAKGGSVYALVRSNTELSLGDIMKILRNIGIDADHYVPPGGVTTYFEDKAVERFKEVFPGRRVMDDSEDLRYYRKLIPYTPALVCVSRIRGELREYDPQSRQWKVVKRLSYSKISATE